MDIEIIRKTQKLANLVLTDSRFNVIQKNLKGILEYINILGEQDVSKYPSTYNASGNLNVTSTDEPDSKTSLTQEQALKNAPESKEGYIVVPRVLKN